MGTSLHSQGQAGPRAGRYTGIQLHRHAWACMYTGMQAGTGTGMQVHGHAGTQTPRQHNLGLPVRSTGYYASTINREVVVQTTISEYYAKFNLS